MERTFQGNSRLCSILGSGVWPSLTFIIYLFCIHIWKDLAERPSHTLVLLQVVCASRRLRPIYTLLSRKPAPPIAVSIAVVVQLRAWPLLWILAMSNGDLALVRGWRFCHVSENAMPFPPVTDSASLWPLGYPSPTFSFRFSSSAQFRFLLDTTTGTSTQQMLRKYIQKANVSVVEKNISLFLIENKDNIFYF